MPLFSRYAEHSRPFIRAATWDVIGSGLMAGSIGTFAGVLARRMHASVEMLTFLSIAPFIGFGVSTLVSRLAYRFHWGAMFGGLNVLCRLMFLPVKLLNGVAGAFVGLVSGSLIIEGSARTLFISLFKAHVEEDERSKVLSLLRIVPAVVMLPAAWIVGHTLDLWPDSYSIIFPACGLVGALMAVPFFALPRRAIETDMQKITPGILDELRVLIEDKPYRVFMIVYSIGTLADKIVLPITPVYFADVLNLEYEQIALAMGILGPLASIVSYTLWALWVKPHNALRLLALSMCLMAVKPVLWGLAAELPLRFAVPCVVSGEVAFRVMVAGFDVAAFTIVLQMSDSRRLPAYAAIHFLFMGFRGIAGPFVGLALYRAGMNITAIYWLVAATVIYGALSLWALDRENRGRMKHG